MNADVRKFVDACREKDVEIFQLSGRGWDKFNEINLHDIYYSGGTFSIQHNICGQILAFDLSAVREVAFGSNSFTTALTITQMNGNFLLLHLKK